MGVAVLPGGGERSEWRLGRCGVAPYEMPAMAARHAARLVRRPGSLPSAAHRVAALAALKRLVAGGLLGRVAAAPADERRRAERRLDDEPPFDSYFRAVKRPEPYVTRHY